MGLLTSNLGESGGFVKLKPDSAAPELQYHFGPDWFVRHGFETPAGHGFTILVGLVGTKSAGELKLLSSDPMAPPSIDFGCLTEEADVQVLLEGIKLGREIAAASPFDEYRGAEFLPGERVAADDELIDYIREFANDNLSSCLQLQNGARSLGGCGRRAARSRDRRLARRRCLDHAAYHKRQHERALHHDRRESGCDDYGGQLRRDQDLERQTSPPGRTQSA